MIDLECFEGRASWAVRGIAYMLVGLILECCCGCFLAKSIKVSEFLCFWAPRTGRCHNSCMLFWTKLRVPLGGTGEVMGSYIYSLVILTYCTLQMIYSLVGNKLQWKQPPVWYKILSTFLVEKREAGKLTESKMLENTFWTFKVRGGVNCFIGEQEHKPTREMWWG